ncbi:ring finger domain-containing protein [Ditylenchus destructor]|nr:ring finger domain-containing protein [Ditylenchus destructor]
MNLICGICMEELGSEKEVCSLPCGHVKHIDCLKTWCEERKNCPNCWQRFQPAVAIRKRLYFDRDPNSDHVVKNETEQDDNVPAANEALKQELDESKAEVDAAQTHVNDLEETISELERKYHNSEVQLEQTSERNRQLTTELHTLEGKNRETFERNRELEQELSNSQAKTQVLEAKFDQTDVSHVIGLVKKMEDGEISRLQKEVAQLSRKTEKRTKAEQDRSQNLTTQMKIETESLKEQIRKKNSEAEKLSYKNTELKKGFLDILKSLTASEKRYADTIKENARVKRELSDSQKRLTTFEKQNCDIIQDNAKMEEQLAEWQRFHRKIGRAARYGDGIGIENQEPTTSQSLQVQNPMHLVPIMNVWNRQKQESGSDGDPAKRARIDPKKSEEAGGKKPANEASGSKNVITS